MGDYIHNPERGDTVLVRGNYYGPEGIEPINESAGIVHRSFVDQTIIVTVFTDTGKMLTGVCAKHAAIQSEHESDAMLWRWNYEALEIPMFSVRSEYKVESNFEPGDDSGDNVEGVISQTLMHGEALRPIPTYSFTDCTVTIHNHAEDSSKLS